MHRAAIGSRSSRRRQHSSHVQEPMNASEVELDFDGHFEIFEIHSLLHLASFIRSTTNVWLNRKHRVLGRDSFVNLIPPWLEHFGSEPCVLRIAKPKAK